MISAGAEAYNSSMLEDVIFSAAYDLLVNPAGASASLRTFDKTAYEKSFGQLFSQLKTANQSEASQAFADSMVAPMQGEIENSGMFPMNSILSPMVVLAHAAGLDQSFAQAFHQASLLCFAVHLVTIHSHSEHRRSLPSCSVHVHPKACNVQHTLQYLSRTCS